MEDIIFAKQSSQSEGKCKTFKKFSNSQFLRKRKSLTNFDLYKLQNNYVSQNTWLDKDIYLSKRISQLSFESDPGDVKSISFLNNDLTNKESNSGKSNKYSRINNEFNVLYQLSKESNIPKRPLPPELPLKLKTDITNPLSNQCKDEIVPELYENNHNIIKASVFEGLSKVNKISCAIPNIVNDKLPQSSSLNNVITELNNSDIISKNLIAPQETSLRSSLTDLYANKESNLPGACSENYPPPLGKFYHKFSPALPSSSSSNFHDQVYKLNQLTSSTNIVSLASISPQVPLLPLVVPNDGNLSNKKYRKTFWDVLAPSYKSKNEDFKKLFLIGSTHNTPNENIKKHNLGTSCEYFENIPTTPLPTSPVSFSSSSNLENASINLAERLIVDYSCALQKEILIQGRMYISQSWLCFYANIFKWEHKIKILFKDIVSINKEKLAKIIPNALTVTTRDGVKYTFASFTSRDKAYLMLFKVWQNALMDQIPIPNSDIWQLVRESYGTELGITSEDEDYIDSQGFKIMNGALSDSQLASQRRSNESLSMAAIQQAEEAMHFVVGGDDKSPDEFYGNIQELHNYEEPVTENLNIEPGITKSKSGTLTFAAPKVSKKGTGDGPELLNSSINKTEFTNSSTNLVSSEEGYSDKEKVFCGCTKHPGKLYLDLIINKSCEEVFQLLFTNSKFFQNLQRERNTKSLIMSEWKSSHDNVNQHLHHGHLHSPKTSELSAKSTALLKKRVLSYVVEISGPLGTKSAPTTEKQTLLVGGDSWSKKSKKYKNKRYVVECEVTNSGVPYSDAYYVICRYCITRAGPRSSLSCRLAVHCLIGYKKSVFSLVKNIIEKNCQSGLQEYFKFLGDKLIQELRAKSISLESGLENGVISKLECNQKKPLISNKKKSSVIFFAQSKKLGLDGQDRLATTNSSSDEMVPKSKRSLRQRYSSATSFTGSPDRWNKNKSKNSIIALPNFSRGTKLLITLPYFIMFLCFIYMAHIKYEMFVMGDKMDFLLHQHIKFPLNETINLETYALLKPSFLSFLFGGSRNGSSYHLLFDATKLSETFKFIDGNIFTRFPGDVLHYTKDLISRLIHIPHNFMCKSSVPISKAEFEHGAQVFSQLLQQMENSIISLKKEFNVSRLYSD